MSKSFIVDESTQLLKDKQGQPYPGGVHVVAKTAREAIEAVQLEAKQKQRPLDNDVIGKLSIRAKRHELEDVASRAQLVNDENDRLVIKRPDSQG